MVNTPYKMIPKRSSSWCQDMQSCKTHWTVWEKFLYCWFWAPI